MTDGTLDGDFFVEGGGSLTFVDDPGPDVIASTINGSLTNRGSVLLDDVSIDFGPSAAITNIGDWTWVTSVFADRRDVVVPGQESTFTNNGAFIMSGEGSLRVNSTWTSSVTNSVTTSGEGLTFASDVTELGTVFVSAGSLVDYRRTVAFAAGSTLDIEIAGVSSPANFGSVSAQLGVTVDPAATLRTSTLGPSPSPTIFDRYTVLDCGASVCPTFATLDTSLGLTQSIVGGDLVLALPTSIPTFINSAPDAVWGDPANWSTGVVPGPTDAAIVPVGADVTVSGSGTTSIGSLTLAGTLRLDTTGSGRTFQILGDSVIESGGLLDITGAIDEGVGFPGTATLNTLALGADLQIDGELSVGTKGIAVSSDPGTFIEVESAGRLVFTGTAAQTVTGAGQLLNGGIIRNQNPQSVTIAGTVDYADGSDSFGDSFIEAAIGEFRFGPTDLGITTVDIETGATFELTSASAASAGNFEVRGTLQSQSLDVSGIVQVRAGGLFVPDGTLDIEGGQVVTAELAPRGEIQLLDGASITGTGLVANSGDVTATGAVTIGSGVTWNSGRNSLVVVDGTLDVQTTNFDAQGSLRVDSGTITFAGNTILRPSSSLTFTVASDGTAGTISTQQLGFEPFPSSGPGPDPDPDQTLARIELDIDESFTGAGPITIFTCTDCAADPPGIANGVEFDEFVTGEFDLIVGRETVEVAILDNKNRSASGGTGFGSSVSVDGDRAVVGSADGITGPAVLERSGGDWELVLQPDNSSSVDVTLDGDQFIADGVLYEFDTGLGQFSATDVIGGTAFDLDGQLALLGDADVGFGATAQVFLRADFANPLVTLEPDVVPATYATDVALVDLGAGDALAAVSAPGDGAVYLFERAEGAWNTTPVRTLTSPDGAGNRFGQSISISEQALVVGEPLNDSPRGDGGAAWIYPIDGTTVADTPIKLTPSEIDGGDQFGSDVSIDGTVVVVGASVAQKFNFPIRDGAAFVYQFDGIDWVETDALRAPDAFSFELFGDGVAASGTDVLVGARRDRNSNGSEAGAVYDYSIEPIEPAVTTELELALSSGSPGSESVVGSISIADLDRVASAGVNAGSTLAAASLADIAGDDPQATALSQISLGATPLTSIVIDSDELSAIPLVNISIDGGWGDIIAGSELENEPFASLTFGQVVRAAGVGNSPQSPDLDSPAGKLAQTPLTSIEVDGTPLTSIPLGAIALGETATHFDRRPGLVCDRCRAVPGSSEL